MVEPLAGALPGSVSAEVASRLAELLDGRLALLHQALGLLGDALVGAGEAYGACEDAATTDFEIDVLVRQGVVRLRGAVADLDDAANAESVAYRVPGVREVVEELEVGG